MTDTLVSRVNRLISGSLNGIVDAVENASPETVMKEAVREIDRAIEQVRHELGEAIAARHLANRRLMDANAKHEELAEKISLAVGEGRDDLAEAAIARQLDLESQIPVLENSIKDLTAQETELEGYVAALQARKREMEDELAVFLASRKTAANDSAGPDAKGRAATARKTDRAEAAFNRAMNGATGLPVPDATDRQTAAKLAELEKMARENRVHERLAAFKASSTKAGG